MRKQFEVKEVMGKWETLNENKNSFAFGDEPFDADEFAQAVREALQAIKKFKILFLGEKMFGKQNLEIATENGVKPDDIFDYANLMVEIGKYSADVYTDESEDHIFTASQIVARALLEYAYIGCGVTPTDETGVLVVWGEDVGIYLPEDVEDDFWDRNFHYDTNSGDMSEIMEIVKRYYPN